MKPEQVWTAKWIADGFFWPRTSVATETRTEQGMLLVPVDGLEAHALQRGRRSERGFAHVMVPPV